MNFLGRYLTGLLAWFSAVYSVETFGHFKTTGNWWLVALALVLSVAFWLLIDWHVAIRQRGGE
jgi:hypothetical protein